MTWPQVAAARMLAVAAPWTDAAIIAAPMAVVLAAIVTGVWSWLVRRQSRPVDGATVEKTRAEAESVQVKTALELLANVRQMMAEQRAEYEGRLARVAADSEARVAALAADSEARLKALSERVSMNEEQQRAMRAALATHALWDDAAVVALREIHPTFPDPPPVSLPDE